MTGPDLVFLGPSLHASEAAELYPDAILLPPAGMGDILSAVRRYRPHAIALIDGTFMQSMAPFHKEILDALAQGIWVIGASSMGALRAAECSPYGMIGIGHVAELYRDGMEDDDEVALLHLDAEGDFRPVSEAMVNIRATLDAAVGYGVLAPEEAAVLAAAQKARYFPERHLMASIQDAQTILGFGHERSEALRSFLRDHPVNVKAADARLAIQALRDLPRGSMPERGPTPHSRVYDATAARDVKVRAESGASATLDQIRRFATLHDNGAEATWSAVRQRAALASLMAATGVTLTEEDFIDARCSLARELGVDISEFDEECRSLDMTPAEVEAMTLEQAYVRRAEQWMIVGASHPMLTTEYLNHLRRIGKYREAREAVAFERSIGMTTSHRSTSISLKTAMETFSGLADFTPPADVDEYIDEMAMGSRAELYEQLITALGTAWEVFGLPVEAPDESGLQDHAISPRHSRGTL